MKPTLISFLLITIIQFGNSLLAQSDLPVVKDSLDHSSVSQRNSPFQSIRGVSQDSLFVDSISIFHTNLNSQITKNGYRDEDGHVYTMRIIIPKDTGAGLRYRASSQDTLRPAPYNYKWSNKLQKKKE